MPHAPFHLCWLPEVTRLCAPARAYAHETILDEGGSGVNAKRGVGSGVHCCRSLRHFIVRPVRALTIRRLKGRL